MRALQLCEVSRYETRVVTRLDFTPGGDALVACLDDELLRYDLATDTATPLFGKDLWTDIGEEFEQGWALSPDRKLLVINADVDGYGYTLFAEAPGRAYNLPIVGNEGGHAAMVFAHDGRTLFAVRSEWSDEGEAIVDRLPLDPLLAPKRLVEKKNPLSGSEYKEPAKTPNWKPILNLPTGKLVSAAALSANEKLLAAGAQDGAVYVCDLKKKAVTASFPWTGRKVKGRGVQRVAFHPAAEWVVSLAAGRLSGHPLGAGKPWHTKDAVGTVHDFAFHPGGRVLCAACADGEARFLDPLTGAVRQSFKWAKKPKPLHSVCFAPDGLTCAAGDASGKVVVWDVDV